MAKPFSRAVALMAGLHLVQDRLAHIGLTNLAQHGFRFFPHRDADPNGPLGKLAQDATAKFLADFKTQLVKNFGQEGADEMVRQMEKAGPELSQQGIDEIISRIAQSLGAPDTPAVIESAEPSPFPGGQGSSALQEELERQCALGNRAACP
jgi:hypothetical protein